MKDETYKLIEHRQIIRKAENALSDALSFQMKVRSKELELENLYNKGKITKEEALRQHKDFIDKL